MLAEQLQEDIYMLKMCRPSATIDEDVVEEDQDKFSEIWSAEVIHKALKSRGGITETKWHDQELIMAFMSSESCLGNVNFLHAKKIYPEHRISMILLSREKCSQASSRGQPPIEQSSITKQDTMLLAGSLYPLYMTHTCNTTSQYRGFY
jgi:hypothetical protein